jgi:hypothetical protein
MRRPLAVTVLAYFDIVMGILFLTAGGVSIVGVVLASHGTLLEPLVGLAVYSVPALLLLHAGLGLRGLRSAGRSSQIAISVLGLLAFPFGTIASVLFLGYFRRPGAIVLFEGGSVHGLSLSEERPPEPEPPSGAWIFGGLVFVLLEMGFLVSITTSLARARGPAGHVNTIGDLRTVVSAEAAYSQRNGGFFDTLECLTAPSPCIPGEAATPAVVYLDAAFLRRERHGYIFTFHPGPAAPSRDAAVTSPSSLTAFAYVATPRASGSGLRAFCGEASGRICFTSSEPMPAIRDGVCPPAPTCTDLQ